MMRQAIQRQRAHVQDGFSLVELIIVIVLIGIIGGVLAMQVLPAIRAYLVIGQRAALTNQADTALRRIVGDVRRAVPNSLRLSGSQCLELVPTSDGGRYRTAPSFTSGKAQGAFLDDASDNRTFDVLMPFSKRPEPGDRIVIANQNPDDVYTPSVPRVSTIADSPAASQGSSQITLENPLRVPDGYTGGRFVVVPRDEQTVVYVCNGGTLYRVAYPSLQAAPRCNLLPVNAPILAKGIEKDGCSFTYSANQGATQESGFVQLRLKLGGNGESVQLTLGAHVANVP